MKKEDFSMIVKTNCCKSYQNAFKALEDLGFTVDYEGKYIYSEGLNRKGTLVTKNGKMYMYKGMDHFNTTIYSVRLLPVKLKAAKDTYPLPPYMMNPTI